MVTYNKNLHVCLETVYILIVQIRVVRLNVFTCNIIYLNITCDVRKGNKKYYKGNKKKILLLRLTYRNTIM